MSIADLIARARKRLTEEERAELLRRSKAAAEKQEQEFIARHRCTICGADTWNYSHTFSCPRRGSGF